MSDIVERLRNMIAIRRDSTPLSVALMTGQEAADEIESLRARLAEANSVFHELHSKLTRVEVRLAAAEALLRYIKTKWPYWSEIDRIDAYLASKE